MKRAAPGQDNQHEEEIRLNINNRKTPEKAKPSARGGRKVTNLHEEKMAELPKDTGIERSAFFILEPATMRASEEKRQNAAEGGDR